MLCTVVFFIHPWLGRPAGGTINCSAEIMVLKAQWKTKFSLPRTTSCEVTQVTDKIYLLMVWQQICWLFSCLCFIKQTNKHIIVIPWAVKAVTVGKAPPFPYSPLYKKGLDVYNDVDGLETQISHFTLYGPISPSKTSHPEQFWA